MAQEQPKLNLTSNPDIPGSKYYEGLNKTTLEYITKLTLGRFYGSVELKFEGGKVVHINQSRSIKP